MSSGVYALLGVVLGGLVTAGVDGDVWRSSYAVPGVVRERVPPPDALAEIAAMEAALRQRFGDEHELLRPGGVPRDALGQAAA